MTGLFRNTVRKSNISLLSAYTSERLSRLPAAHSIYLL
jgi:hypothetical protein